MRIFTIGPADSPHTTRPVKSLLRKKHDVCLLGYHASNPLAGEKYKKYLWFRDPGNAPFPRSDSGIEATYTQLARIFKTFRPDVVHIHWLSWHLLPCHKISPDTPIVVSIWGTDMNIAVDPIGNGEYEWGTTLETLNARNLYLAKHIVIDDPTMKAKCGFAAPETPQTLLSLGADDFFFHPDRTNAERLAAQISPEPAHIFTSMRNVRNNYRSDVILEAFAQAAKGRNAKLVFKSFLHHAPQWTALSEMARSLGVEKQVHFMEHLEPKDLRDLYSASTALVNFPVRDGFPVSFAEAGAVGADVITCWNPAYDVPLARECFDILPDDSVQSLAAAMKKKLDLPIYPRRSNEKAIAITERDLSHKGYVERLEKIYQNLLGEGK